eukprot:11318437-Alexandrium_andersonii.AAC.1
MVTTKRAGGRAGGASQGVQGGGAPPGKTRVGEPEPILTRGLCPLVSRRFETPLQAEHQLKSAPSKARQLRT